MPLHVASLVGGTARAHAEALVSATQVKPGEKLPLGVTVKEEDAANPITLAPTGKNIFVRTICALALPMTRPHPFLLSFSSSSRDIFAYVIMHKLTISFVLPLCSPIGWRTWSLHAQMSFAGTKIHRKVRRVQGEGR